MFSGKYIERAYRGWQPSLSRTICLFLLCFSRVFSTLIWQLKLLKSKWNLLNVVFIFIDKTLGNVDKGKEKSFSIDWSLFKEYLRFLWLITLNISHSSKTSLRYPSTLIKMTIEYRTSNTPEVCPWQPDSRGRNDRITSL